ncbi:MAG: DUF4249 domain-containing protein [Bacteroidetes bacterium]|jgi:hypothetical protein|nr:DUF4249 domain-containing protein [Bacteroidota bacterium]
MTKLRTLFLMLILGLMCCKKPYNPPATSTSQSYLIVEGVINTGNDSTVIKLSRTVKLTDKITDNPVLNATVTVEGEQGGTYPLYDVYGNGHYNSVNSLNLNSTQRYRVRILPAEGGQYVSDFVEVKPTPPIDSVGYNVKDTTVNLYVNAHDATNKTRFYLWDYDEAWIFHAKYASLYVLDPTGIQMVPRTRNQMIYSCFANDKSVNIIATSTEKLSSDVVYQGPLASIALSSEKMESKYSILVRQYALTQDAYNFYQNMKKNTEQLGSIFDAQPSEISGNIHNTANPAEPVVGYISATNVQSKRIFIKHADLPGNVLPIYPYTCEQDTALYKDKTGTNVVQNVLINPPIDYFATSAIEASGGGIIGFLYSTRVCVDCTLRGKVDTPAFWK